MSKQHYILLDALRGVAALLVVLYHLFEAIAFAQGAAEQHFFHGFLAVDFFLVLSGFVMGYAYDDRWSEMSVPSFLKRRLVRLHPMVVMGVFVGLVVFLCQGCMKWDGTQAGAGSLIASVILALFMLPAPAFADVRGNTEMFPLNGPHWSLFFEYIGSIMYAFFLRKMSTRALKIWVAVAVIALLAMGIFGPDGSIAYGWSSKPLNALGGFLRMSFAYPAGLLLSRLFKEKKPAPISGKILFPVCATALAAALAVPSLGAAKVWYEVFCVSVIFPAIIWVAARAEFSDGGFKCAMSGLGGISYPLYAIHYPFIYLYIGWISKGVNPFGPAWLTPVVIAAVCIALAAICLKFYDIPLRRKLSERLR